MIAIEKLKDSIVINNKGELLFPEKEFGKKSESRNRLLSDLLAKTEYMEKAGTGIQRIKDACNDNFNSVNFSFSDSFMVEIFSFKNEGVSEGVKQIYNLIKQNPGNRAPFFAEAMNTSVKNVERWLKQLKDEGKVEFRGAAKNGGYFDKSLIE